MRQKGAGGDLHGFIILVWREAHLLPDALCQLALLSQRHAGGRQSRLHLSHDLQ